MVHYLPRPDGWDDAYRKAALAAGMGELTVEHALRGCGVCRYYKELELAPPFINGRCGKTNHFCNTERGATGLELEAYCGRQGRWWEPRPCAG